MARAERLQRFRERRAQAGLSRIDLYVPSSDVQLMRQLAHRLATQGDIRVALSAALEAPDFQPQPAPAQPLVRSRGAKSNFSSDAPRPDGAGRPSPAVAGNAAKRPLAGCVAGDEDGGILASSGRVGAASQ